MARDTIYDRVTTPAALENFVLGVKRGNYPSLVVVGRGGTGKSTLVRKHFPQNDPEAPAPADKNDGAYWKKGRLSPIKLYFHLYEHRDYNIVIDDPPDLGKNLTLAGLLRQACETEDVRTVSWDTQNRYLGGDFGPPYSFQTRSKVILITNQWMGRHPEIEALETRVPIVLYEPSPQLIHSQAIEGAKAKLRDDLGKLRFEPAVVQYVGQAIKEDRVHTLNLRDYINASRRMRNGDDWKAAIEKQILPDEIEGTDSDVDYVKAWMVRNNLTTITSGSLYRATRRFRTADRNGRGRQEAEEVLAWMAGKGLLLKKNPKLREGPGRKPMTEYVLPPFSVVTGEQTRTTRMTRTKRARKVRA